MNNLPQIKYILLSKKQKATVFFKKVSSCLFFAVKFPPNCGVVCKAIVLD